MVDENWGGASADKYDIGKMEKAEAPAVETGEKVSSSEAGERVFASLKERFAGFGEKASKVGKTLGKFGLRMLAPKHLLSEAGSAIGGAAAEAGKAVGNATVEAGKAVGGAVSSGIETVGGTVIRGAEAVGGAAVEAYKYTTEATKAKASEIAERATGAWERADSWVVENSNKATSAIEAAGVRSVEATKAAAEKIKDTSTQAWTKGVLEPVASARAFVAEKSADFSSWEKDNRWDALQGLRSQLSKAIELVDSKIAELEGGSTQAEAEEAPEAEEASVA